MIYRAIRKLKAVLYHAIVEPDIKRSFAECGKDSHIDSGGDFFPLSNIHVGNHASIGVNARFWTTRAKNLHRGLCLVWSRCHDHYRRSPQGHHR